MKEKKKYVDFKAKAKKEENESISNYVFGKVQPQSLDLEMGVLGAVMLDADAIYEIMDIVNEESFYLPKHQSIYRAITQLFKKSSAIDILTVTEQIKANGDLDDIGGAYYIVELTNRVASAVNIKDHSNIIQEKYVRRKVIKLASEAISRAYDDGVKTHELLDGFDIGMIAAKESFYKGGQETLRDTANSFLEELDKKMNQDGDKLGGERLFGNALDDALNGVEETDVVLIPGRPAMGKSSVLNSALVHAVKENMPVCFWSFEMANKRTFRRGISAMANVDGKRLSAGRIKEYELQGIHDATESIANSNIIIRDDHVNIHQFKSQVALMKRKHGIKAVFVDRVGLFDMTDSKMNDFSHVSQVSPILRKMANELKVPVIALCQLSRAVEIRGGDKRPILADIRSSGSLEQDATKIAFVYRPEYYDILEDELGNSLKGVAELIIGKNNDGDTSTVKLKFKGSTTSFHDLDEDIFNIPVEDNSSMNSVRQNDDDIPF